MHYPFWVGQDIFLSLVEKEEYATSMVRWVHDPETSYYMLTGLVPTTPQALAEEHEQLTRSQNDVFLGIIEKSTSARSPS